MQFSTRMAIRALALLACGAAHPATIAPAQREALNACVVRAAEALHFNGSVYLGQRGDAFVSRNFGTADAEGKVSVSDRTRFNIASAGKIFTAVGIGMLAERGGVDWDASIGRYLPDLDGRFTAITIRELVQHTSGLGDYLTPDNLRAIDEAATATDLLPLALAVPPEFAPGSSMAYSNSGYVVLGAIIEKLTGLSYGDFVQREIAAPLGMADTRATAVGAAEPMTRLAPDGALQDRPRPSPMQPRHASPAGGMFSTASDMARLLSALAANRLVKAETLAVLFPPRAHTPARVGHNGGAPGVNAEIWFYPESGWQLIALANADPPVATRMAVVLESALFAADPAAACTEALAAPPPQMPLPRTRP
jgi:CubicO group peptidase (beta-lactamase class C family)